MKTETERVLELLQTRLDQLRLLAEDLVECRQSFVELNLAGIRDHTRRQEQVCAAIQMLDAELGRQVALLSAAKRLPRRLNPFDALSDLFTGDARNQLTPLMAAMAATQREVRGLNQIYAELLNRSRRSLNILANIMPSASGTYEPPRRQVSLAPFSTGI